MTQKRTTETASTVGRIDHQIVDVAFDASGVSAQMHETNQASLLGHCEVRGGIRVRRREIVASEITARERRLSLRQAALLLSVRSVAAAVMARGLLP